MASNRGLPHAQRLTLAGPAGAIEALLETPTAEPARAFAVVCHPHPLYGGTLQNKVVHTLARSFAELGAATLRFNFRGVGASAGQFAEGVGEIEDTLAVVDAGRERFADLPLWLGGFSFGGAVAVRAAGRTEPKFLVSVAPAVKLINLSDIKVPACPWLIVQGGADEFVEADAVIDWAAQLNPAPTVKLLPGVGHFFHGQLRKLAAVVLDFAHQQGVARESEKSG